MKLLILLFLLTLSLISKDVFPSFSLHTKGIISDFVVKGNRLYVATDIGSVDIFDLKLKKIIEQISLEPIMTTKGKFVSASISSVDVYKSKILIVSRGLGNYRNVWIYENNIFKKIVDERQKLLVKEARFVDENSVLLAGVDSDISLYDLSEKSSLYRHHISDSRLSDMVLSKDKKSFITADESGEVKMFDIENAKQKDEIPPKNLDNIFHIAYSNGVIITAGQDRRVAVYQENEPSYYLKSDFFVYCVGLSPSAEIGVYSDGEENDLQVFDTYTKQKKDRLVGHKKIIRKIHFISEKRLISSDQGHDIFFWEL